MKVVTLAAVVLLAACGKSKQECRREAEDLGKTLRDMDRSPGIETRSVKLVLRADLPASDDYGPLLELSDDGARVMGLMDGPGPPAAALQAIGGMGLGDPLAAIDGSTSWTRVVELFDALDAAQLAHVRLVFGRPPTKQQPPPRSSIDGQLDAIIKDPEPAGKAVKVAALAAKLVADCPAVANLFGAVDPTTSKEEALISGLPPALIACNCRCDVPALKSLMWRMMANQHPTTTLTVPLSRSAAPLQLPGKTRWSEASQKIAPGVPLRAVAKP